MKKIGLIIISLLMIISGCSLNVNSIDKIVMDKESIILDMTMNEEKLVLLELGEYDEAKDKCHFIIHIYNLDDLSKESYELNNDLEYASSCEFDEQERLCLYDESIEKKAIYNENMKLIGIEAYDVENKKKLIDNNLISCRSFYDRHVAYDNSEYNIIDNKKEETTYIALENHKQELLLYKHGMGSVWGYNGQTLLTSYWDTQKGSINFEVFDGDSKQLINQYCIEDVDEQGYIMDACLSQEKASFIWCENDEVTLYIWNYRSHMINETRDLVALNSEDIDKMNKKLENDIEKAYDIELYIDDEKIDKYDLEYDFAYGSKLMDRYYFMKKYESFLTTLPDGLISDLSDNEVFDKRVMGIYLVKEIIGDTQAFACAYLENDIIMCFASEEMMDSNFPHELMHIMNAIIPRRLNDHNRSYYDEWMELNPDGFYFYESNEYEDYQQYFITEYMMSDIEEDQAVLFECLYDILSYKEKPYWMENKPLLKKAYYLLEVINTSFPSVKGSYWEDMYKQVKEWNDNV